MMKKQTSPEYSSPLYKEIYNAKNNRKILPNGDVMIGNTHILSRKDNIIYKLFPQKNQAATGSLRIFKVQKIKVWKCW